MMSRSSILSARPSNLTQSDLNCRPEITGARDYIDCCFAQAPRNAKECQDLLQPRQTGVPSPWRGPPSDGGDQGRRKGDGSACLAPFSFLLLLGPGACFLQPLAAGSDNRIARLAARPIQIIIS